MNLPSSSLCKHARAFFQNSSCLAFSSSYWSKLSQHFSSLKISFFIFIFLQRENRIEIWWRNVKNEAMRCLWKLIKEFVTNNYAPRYSFVEYLHFYLSVMGGVSGIKQGYFSQSSKEKEVQIVGGKGKCIVAYLHRHVK